MTRVLPPHVALYGTIMLVGALLFFWGNTGVLDRVTVIAAAITAFIATSAYGLIGMIPNLMRKS